MSTPSSARRAERRQARHAYNGSRAGSLFRGTESRPHDRRSLGLKVAGGVRIDVYVRCRPMNSMEDGAGDAEVVAVDSAKRTVSIKATPGIKRSSDTFAYDATFGPHSTQEEVYAQVAAPVVEEVCRGMNCCVMAYGQTGTGKTFTMAGDVTPAGVAAGHEGLIPRSVRSIFEAKTVTDEFTGAAIARDKITVSFLEVYNEQLEDLLSIPEAGAGAAPELPLKLVDDKDNGTVCQNLTEVEVTDVAQVMELLDEAQRRSHVSATKLNKQSNRAHRVFTITAVFGSHKTRKVGRLTLVDLAGSECVGRSGAVDATAKEAGTINKSLLTLGRVIHALAHNEKHVPYRDSKLTRLLAEALGGVCKTSIIATVSPAGISVEESLSTLRYAQSAMDAMNISQMPKARRLELQLKQMVAAYDQLAKDSERHIRALQRSVAVAMTERRQLESRNEALTQELKNTLEQKAEVEHSNRELKRDLEEAVRHRNVLESTLRATHTDLVDIVQRSDVQTRTNEQLQAQLAHVTKERDHILDQQRRHFDGVKKRAGACEGEVKSLKGSAEAAVSRQYTATTRELANLHEKVAKWAERDVSGHLDTYARNTEFVADLTKSLNVVDRLVKQGMLEVLNTLSIDQAAVAKTVEAEVAATREEQKRLVDGMTKMVAAFASASEKRLTSVSGATSNIVANHSKQVDRVVDKVAHCLMGVGNAASEFHKRSEDEESASKARTLSHVKATADTITAVQEGVDVLKEDAVGTLGKLLGTVNDMNTDTLAQCLMGSSAADQLTEFPAEPISRRSVDVISTTNPERVPRSASRNFEGMLTPDPPATTPALCSPQPLATPVTMADSNAPKDEVLSPHARLPTRLDSMLSDDGVMKLTENNREVEVKVQESKDFEGDAGDRDDMSELSDGEGDAEEDEKANEKEDPEMSPARAKLREELAFAALAAPSVPKLASPHGDDEEADMTYSKPLLPEGLLADLARGSALAAPSPQAIHQILRDTMTETVGAPTERSSSPMSYAARREALNRRLNEKAKARSHSALSQSSSTSSLPKAKSYTSLTGGKFTPVKRSPPGRRTRKTRKARG